MQQPQYEVIINYGNDRPTNPRAINIISLRFAKPDDFGNRISDLIKLGYRKL